MTRLSEPKQNDAREARTYGSWRARDLPNRPISLCVPTIFATVPPDMLPLSLARNAARRMNHDIAQEFAGGISAEQKCLYKSA